jgi:hypothetical protein
LLPLMEAIALGETGASGRRQRKEYVPMKRLSDVVLEIERQRAEATRPTEVRRMLTDVALVVVCVGDQ